MKNQIINTPSCLNAATWKKLGVAALVVIGLGAFGQNTNAQTPAVKNTLLVIKPAKAETHPDQIAQFPGGMKGLIQFLSKNLQHPKGAVEGKVFATFVVKEDGSLDDIQIIRKLSPVNDAEVLRVLKLSPKWTPGTKDGQPVDTQYTLPISFSKT